MKISALELVRHGCESCHCHLLALWTWVNDWRLQVFDSSSMKSREQYLHPVMRGLKEVLGESLAQSWQWMRGGYYSPLPFGISEGIMWLACRRISGPGPRLKNKNPLRCRARCGLVLSDLGNWLDFSHHQNPGFCLEFWDWFQLKHPEPLCFVSFSLGVTFIFHALYLTDLCVSGHSHWTPQSLGPHEISLLLCLPDSTC